MSRVLIITYYWPPSGGAGVQRWLKFSKYLPESGWDPVILTVSVENAAYSVTDQSLESEIPPGLKVHRTRATDWYRLYSKDRSKVPSAGFANIKDDSISGRISRFIRGNFFIPDPRRGWNKHAFKRACELIEQEKINHIVTTSPPHSTQLIGLKLKKRYPGVKWLADLRDPWTDIYYYKLFYPSFIAKIIDSKYERKVIRKADIIITVGKRLAETIRSIDGGPGKKIHVITNGYDDDDFRDLSVGKPDKFTITYVGTLSEAYPMDKFISALQIIKNKGFDFILRFVGSVNDKIRKDIENRLDSKDFEFIPYSTHKEAVNYMKSSSALLLIIPALGNNRAIITGKLFEYIASQRPVLLIGPTDGDAAQILRKCGHKGIFTGDNAEEIEKFMMSLMSSAESVKLTGHPEFSRKVLTQKLSGILTNL